jgi:hypothetical protein
VSKPFAADEIVVTGAQKGKEFVLVATEEVVVTFAGGFTYSDATGADGYSVVVSIYVDDGDDPLWWSITAKTTTGFTIKTGRTFTGEVDWSTQGTPA